MSRHVPAWFRHADRAKSAARDPRRPLGGVWSRPLTRSRRSLTRRSLCNIHMLLVLALVGCSGGTAETGSGSDVYDEDPIAYPPAISEGVSPDPGCTEEHPYVAPVDDALQLLVSACTTSDGYSLHVINLAPAVLTVRPLVDMEAFVVNRASADQLAAILTQNLWDGDYYDGSNAARLLPGSSLIAVGAYEPALVSLEADATGSQLAYTTQVFGSFLENKLENTSMAITSGAQQCASAIAQAGANYDLSAWQDALAYGINNYTECKSFVAAMEEDAAPSLSDDLVRYSDDIVREADELTLAAEFGKHVRTSLWDDALQFAGRIVQISK